MNKLIHYFIFLILILSFTGCSTLSKASYDINAGMTKQNVINKLGMPYRRSVNGSQEALQYAEISHIGNCRYINIWLNDNKVESLTTRIGKSVCGCSYGLENIIWETPSNNKMIIIQNNNK